MEDETKIREAEFELVTEHSEEGGSKIGDATRNKKRDFYVELVLLFILGILIGIAIKTEAYEKITIGFDDYRMRPAKQDFNINNLQADVARKNAETAAAKKAESDQQKESASESNEKTAD